MSDDEFRTDWEREDDEFRERQIPVTADLIGDLDRAEAAREAVEHDDPVGAVWFGEYPRAADADEWWKRRGL
jgi:hypothetical protein